MRAAPRAGAVPPTRTVRGDSALRRMVDFLVAALALLALAPMLAAVAFMIRCSSPGPAFYLQERIGRDGHPFRMLKFRTMVLGADRAGALVTGRRDPRVTRMGAALRATKVDELPQLINVLWGHMTLVGPRPEVARYVRAYSGPEQEVLTVRPGLTGPGQLYFSAVQAADLDGRADAEQHYLTVQLHRKLAIDLDYLIHRTVRRDLVVVVQTVLSLLMRH